MQNKNNIYFQNENATDLAFAIVVLASYFVSFTEIKLVSSFEIVLMIALGVAYLTLGIYGFEYCRGSNYTSINYMYFICQIILGGLILFLAKNSGFIALILLPLVGQSVILLKAQPLLFVNALIIVIYILNIGLITQSVTDIWDRLPSFLVGQILIIAFTQMVVNEQKARKNLEKLAEELSVVNKSLRDYSDQIEELTIAKERNRFAREIHDGLAHYLTTIFMQIQAARLIINKNSKGALSSLEKAQNLSQEALDDVRKSVDALREGQTDTFLLNEKLNNIINNAIAYKITPDFEILGTPRPLSAKTELTLFRAAQEAINNAFKHAQAKYIWVKLDYRDATKVIFDYKDDGVGSNDLSGGFGLLGMRERVQIINGKIYFESEIGKGFHLLIEIPE